jgi:hypothetical protein
MYAVVQLRAWCWCQHWWLGRHAAGVCMPKREVCCVRCVCLTHQCYWLHGCFCLLQCEELAGACCVTMLCWDYMAAVAGL